ncbi:MAG: class I SAM-dependent methyltransferase [Candidatus Caldarchaeum sp.]
MNLEVLHTTPAQLAMSERLLLYALVYGLRPSRCLEIGTAQGGSALITCAALDRLGAGQLIIVDPSPQIAPEHWARMAHRAVLIEQPSPQALPQAYQVAQSRFDFVFIDGNHHFEYVLQDIEGVLPFLKEGAYILLHDAHYFEVAEAVAVALQRHPHLVDCGMISTEANITNDFYKGKRVIWAGFRLLRFSCLKKSPTVAARLGQTFKKLLGR